LPLANSIPAVLRVAVFFIFAFLSSHSRALAEGAEDSLLEYAASLRLSNRIQSWSGYGIYLGKGLFITAAHVVGRAWLNNPRVAAAGREFSTTVVKEGSFEGTDLTLLSIEERLLPMRWALRRNSLCKQPPTPGQTVVTIIPGEAARSYIVAPEQLPLSLRHFRTAIADLTQTGNSGSGVFDVQRRCLMGIVSRKLSQLRTPNDTGKTETYHIAKYFVPASDIAAFLRRQYQ
jgi:hypothetical protein